MGPSAKQLYLQRSGKITRKSFWKKSVLDIWRETFCIATHNTPFEHHPFSRTMAQEATFYIHSSRIQNAICHFVCVDWIWVWNLSIAHWNKSTVHFYLTRGHKNCVTELSTLLYNRGTWRNALWCWIGDSERVNTVILYQTSMTDFVSYGMYW